MRSGVFWAVLAVASCLVLGASLAVGYQAGERWAARAAALTAAKSVPVVSVAAKAPASQAAALPQAKTVAQAVVATAIAVPVRLWEAQPLPTVAQIHAYQKSKFTPTLDWWISGSVVRQGKMCLIVELSAGASPQFKCAGELLPGGAKLLRVAEGQAQVSTLVGSELKNIVLEF